LIDGGGEEETGNPAQTDGVGSEPENPQ